MKKVTQIFERELDELDRRASRPIPLIEGKSYTIEEWDGSLDSVTIFHLSPSDVWMRYGDGVVHRVSQQYFRSLVREIAS